MKRARLWFTLALSMTTTSFAFGAEEEEAPPPQTAVAPAPILAWTYGAHGLPAGSFGAFGQGALAADTRDARAGGGVTAWVAPLERLTIVGDASRDVRGAFTPSLAGLVRLAGDGREGFALSALGKFKVDGFAEGPNREIESELESGVLVGFARSGFHLDANAIAGIGLGDDGEIDVEGRARAGYDLDRDGHVRIGMDGQTRSRVAGTYRLPGDRSWDFAFGPQLVMTWRPMFVALTAGPTTTSTSAPLAWTAIATIGAARF